MNVTKFGHACLLVEEKGVRILIDPGSYSTGFENLTNLSVILYTHEHQDHINLESLTKLLMHNPNVKIRTNHGVAKLLESKNIPYKLLTNNQSENFNGVEIKAYGEHHLIIHGDIGCIDNTGYLIGNRLFYPGDALVVPPLEVEILALPIEAPWMKLGDAMDYVLKVKPKVCFAVHDARLSEIGMKSNLHLAALILKDLKLEVKQLENSKQYKF